MKEIVLHITAKASKEYTIKLDDAFAAAFERDIQKLLGGKTQFDVKELLYAFMQKCHDCYEQETHINGIVGNLSKTLDDI